jgi:sialidase-1
MPTAPSAGEGFYEKVLFSRTKPTDDHCRILSAALAPDGGLLLFAGLRHGSGGDFGHQTDMVMWRSGDGGRRFSRRRTIVRRKDVDIHTGPVVVDRKRKRVLKFCRFWPSRVPTGEAPNPQVYVRRTPYRKMLAEGWVDYVITSDDSGRTWSKPRRLELPFPEGVYSAATGNGVHGIQLPGGRLIIQAGYVLRPAVGKESQGRRWWRSCIFYSDDGGEAWDLGGCTPHASIREFALAALGGEEVYFNARNAGPETGRRLVGRSDDAGRTYPPLRPDEHLPGPSCHAGLDYLPDYPRAGASLMVFTCPAEPNRNNTSYNPEARVNMTVRLSYDRGRTWPDGARLWGQRAGYSDVAVGADGTIHVIYERGPMEKSHHEQVVYSRLTPAWVRAHTAGRRG